MKTIEEVRKTQKYLINEINRIFDEVANVLQNREDENERELPVFETVYPLTTDPAIFKGQKPTCVLFGEERAIAHTWKNVFKLLILRCNEDEKKHKILLGLRNKILGRERIILSDKPGEMLRAFKIDEDLWAETHYDTETLMRILLHRILDKVGFDYSNISVAVRN